MPILIIAGLVVVLVVLIAARAAQADVAAEQRAGSVPSDAGAIGMPADVPSGGPPRGWDRASQDPFEGVRPMRIAAENDSTQRQPVALHSHGPTVGQIAAGVALGMWIFAITSALAAAAVAAALGWSLSR